MTIFMHLFKHTAQVADCIIQKYFHFVICYQIKISWSFHKKFVHQTNKTLKKVRTRSIAFSSDIYSWYSVVKSQRFHSMGQTVTNPLSVKSNQGRVSQCLYVGNYPSVSPISGGGSDVARLFWLIAICVGRVHPLERQVITQNVVLIATAHINLICNSHTNKLVRSITHSLLT